ncbi:MAG: hypothetical protein L0Z70_04135 [Chloroflexi bacterium]|nr:hypothetical protein [Chloroflexota bacterium]
MVLKKLALTVLVLALAFSTLAIGYYGTKSTSIKFGETKEIMQGRAGVTFTKSQFTGTVKLTRISGGNAPGEGGPKFAQKLINVRLTDRDGNNVSIIKGAVYVFFMVRQRELRLYDRGELAIYRWDGSGQRWIECDTLEVGSRNGTTALSCRMSQFGLYGLGSK